MVDVSKISRLKAQLLSSGIAERNQALYQVVNLLIDELISVGRQANTEISAIEENVIQLPTPNISRIFLLMGG